MPKNRNFGLDFLRATAIILVLIAHLINESLPGILGVEMFFVLSGFLIGRILYKIISTSSSFKKKDLIDFLKKRWFRTIPNFLFYFILYLIFHDYNLFERSYSLQHKDFLGLLFLQNFVSPGSAFFNVSWSLSVEEWFYFLMAFSVFSFNSFLSKKVSLKKTFFLVILIMLIIPLFFRVTDLLELDNYRKVVLGRLDALMYGVILSIIYLDYRFIWEIIRKFSFIWVGGLLVVFIFIDYSNPFFFSLAPLFLTLLIPYFYSFTIPFKKVRDQITFVALISYSLYLSHMLIYGVLYYLLIEFKDILLIKIGVKFFTLVLCFGLSYFTYKNIELYFIRFRSLSIAFPLRRMEFIKIKLNGKKDYFASKKQ